jgi:hypothetical protein
VKLVFAPNPDLHPVRAAIWEREKHIAGTPTMQPGLKRTHDDVRTLSFSAKFGLNPTQWPF